VFGPSYRGFCYLVLFYRELVFVSRRLFSLSCHVFVFAVSCSLFVESFMPLPCSTVKKVHEFSRHYITLFLVLKYDRLFYAATTCSKHSLLFFQFFFHLVGLWNGLNSRIFRTKTLGFLTNSPSVITTIPRLTPVLGHVRLKVNFSHPLITACCKLRSHFLCKQWPKLCISCHVRDDAGVQLKVIPSK